MIMTMYPERHKHVADVMLDFTVVHLDRIATIVMETTYLRFINYISKIKQMHVFISLISMEYTVHDPTLNIDKLLA